MTLSHLYDLYPTGLQVNPMGYVSDQPLPPVVVRIYGRNSEVFVNRPAEKVVTPFLASDLIVESRAMHKCTVLSSETGPQLGTEPRVGVQNHKGKDSSNYKFRV